MRGVKGEDFGIKKPKGCELEESARDRRWKISRKKRHQEHKKLMQASLTSELGTLPENATKGYQGRRKQLVGPIES